MDESKFPSRCEKANTFIIDYWQKHRCPPSHREIMAAIDCNSLSYVTRVLHKLELSGLITRNTRRQILPVGLQINITH